MKLMVTLILVAFVLSGCGGDHSEAQRQEFVDKCIIDAGPQSRFSNINEYCYAKWRQSQREMMLITPLVWHTVLYRMSLAIRIHR